MKNPAYFDSVLQTIKTRQPDETLSIDLADQDLAQEDFTLLIQSLSPHLLALKRLDLSGNPRVAQAVSDWLAGQPTLTGLTALALDHLPLALPAWKALSASLGQQPALQRLSLVNVGLQSENAIMLLAQALRPCTQLRQFQVSNNHLGLAGLRSLAIALAHATQLSAWQADQCQLQPGDLALLLNDVNWPALRVLSLSHNQLGHEDVVSLQAWLRQHPALLALRLDHNPLLEQHTVALGFNDLSHLPLHSLNLADIGFFDFPASPQNAEFWTTLSQATTLVDLNVAHNAFTGAAFERFLTHLPRLTRLRRLNLANTGLKGGAALGEALAAQSSLQSLDLTGNDVGASSLALCNALQRHTALQQLHLTFTTLAPEGMTAFAALVQTHRTLRYLKLSQLTREQAINASDFATFLAQGVAKNSSLYSLDLSECLLDNLSLAALQGAFANHPTLYDVRLPPACTGECASPIQALNAKKQSVLQGLHSAIVNGVLVQEHLNPERLLQPYGAHGDTLLHAAVRAGQFQTVRELIGWHKQLKVPLDALNHHGETPALLAATVGAADLLALFPGTQPWLEALPLVVRQAHTLKARYQSLEHTRIKLFDDDKDEESLTLNSLYVNLPVDSLKKVTEA